MSLRNLPSILAVVCYFLYNTAQAIPLGKEGCSPSSCGSLGNISYPFRLQHDPPGCGDTNYELLCDGNNTILSLRSGKYYVKEISYDNSTMRLVDVGMASGSCHLPSLSFSSDEFDYTQRFYLIENYYIISFANCTREINDTSYKPMHCLSGNSSTVYVIQTETVDGLDNSCSFIAMTPFESWSSYSVNVLDDLGDDIFETLRKGFFVSWAHEIYHRPSRAKVIRECWRDKARYAHIRPRYLRRLNLIFMEIPFISLEIDFLYCINEKSGEYNHSQLTFRLVVMLAILVDLVALRIVLAVLGRFVITPLSILVFLGYKFLEAHASVDNVEKFLQSQPSLTPTRYSYIDIINMTSHFKEKLGQGGFGSVFKGKLPGGREVAVKMLGNSKCNGDEFISEVSTIGRIHHINIVHLVGFCSDGVNRALVYEFMPNGSLDRHIFSNGTRHQFTPDKLCEIALGVARGIDYLHQGCDMRILHFDIKPHNILLDYRFTPKVSDFGLAKLYPKDHSLVALSVARGTIGYIAPELISRSFGVISHKSDVYSFGMLLLEMAGRRRNADPRTDQSSQFYYPSWIYDKLNQSETPEINETFEIDKLERKLCIVGLWCIQMRSSDRPSMIKVIQMLESDVDSLQMPPKPFLFSSQMDSIEQSVLESSATELSIISES